MSSTDQNRQAFAAAAQATLADSGPFSWTPWTAEEFATQLAPSHPHYRIEAFVDRGGMGAVYRATDTRDGRSVAIKVMQPGLGAEYGERFEREIQILRSLSHPHLISILDRGLTAGGSPFLVMPFLEGRTLAQLIASGQRLPMPRLLQLMQQLCDGIAHAHEKGIIHRDLKPANIFLIDPDESAVILDFGIARALVPLDGLHTQTGRIHGTQGYLAPEVRQGRKAEKAADIYSLGVILYQMLSGKLPEGNYAQPSTFGFDARFDSILAKSLHQDPTLRYQSAKDLSLALSLVTTLHPSLWLKLRNVYPTKQTIRGILFFICSLIFSAIMIALICFILWIDRIEKSESKVEAAKLLQAISKQEQTAPSQQIEQSPKFLSTKERVAELREQIDKQKQLAAQVAVNPNGAYYQYIDGKRNILGHYFVFHSNNTAEMYGLGAKRADGHWRIQGTVLILTDIKNGETVEFKVVSERELEQLGLLGALLPNAAKFIRD